MMTHTKLFKHLTMMNQPLQTTKSVKVVPPSPTKSPTAWQDNLFPKTPMQKSQQKAVSEFIAELEDFRTSAEYLPTYLDDLLAIVDNFLEKSESYFETRHFSHNHPEMNLFKQLSSIKKELEEVKKDYESVRRYFLTVTPTIVKLYSKS